MEPALHTGTTGAIKPTLIERLNATLPVPYAVSSLAVALLLGPLGFFLVDLLSYLDPVKATSVFLSASLDHYTLSQLVGNNVVYPGIIFYCAYMLRFMRRRITRVEEKLLSDSPEWGGTILKSFGRISGTGPSLVVTVAIFLFSFPLVVSQVANNQGFAQLFFAITYPVFFFGAGSFIWMYVSSLWGLYKVGTKPLNLRPYLEDPLLGLKGFGNISLSLTVVYLLAVFLAIYEFTTFAASMPLPLTLLFSGVLVGLGVLMFFLPLLNIHRRMIGERERLRNENMGEVVQLLSGGRARSGLEDLRRILLLEHEGEQIQTIASWPFDAPILRSLAVIVIGIVVSIIAHLIIVALNI